jgi:hypothetical protein
MRQSIKQKIITSPEQQILSPSFSEAMSQAAAFRDIEMSAEFSSVQEKLKSVPKKTLR